MPIFSKPAVRHPRELALLDILGYLCMKVSRGKPSATRGPTVEYRGSVPRAALSCDVLEAEMHGPQLLNANSARTNKHCLTERATDLIASSWGVDSIS